MRGAGLVNDLPREIYKRVDLRRTWNRIRSKVSDSSGATQSLLSASPERGNGPLGMLREEIHPALSQGVITSTHQIIILGNSRGAKGVPEEDKYRIDRPGLSGYAMDGTLVRE